MKTKLDPNNKSGGDSLLNSGRSHSVTQPTDIVTLKRLNFLRNSLESHNARETTQHLRE